jgi:hypothetical protein
MTTGSTPGKIYESLLSKFKKVPGQDKSVRQNLRIIYKIFQALG